MIDKLKKFKDNILIFDNKYSKYIIISSFSMVMIGSELGKLKFYDISNVICLIGTSMMAGLLGLAILNLIISLILTQIERR
jgi:polyferredoxin